VPRIGPIEMAYHTRHTKGITTAIVLVFALLAALVTTSPIPPAAAVASPGCPAGTSVFNDVATSFARADIACIYRLEITRGTSRPNRFDPGATVTRGQMGAFLARFWRATGSSCQGGNLPFEDVPKSSLLYSDIDCIYQLGITKGVTKRFYEPTAIVTREQMGAFLARLWRKTGATCPSGSKPFADVPDTSIAVADISCLRQLGVTKGVGGNRYAPYQGVTREQMAAFLAALWRATGDIPGPGVVPVRPHLDPPAALPTTPGSTFPFEGIWIPRGPLIDGYHGVYSTVVRPSATQPSILVFEAWIDPLLTDLELFPGSQRPGGSWTQPHYVPADRCQNLIFAGNGGFKLTQSRGGYYSEGRAAYPLRDGAASFVFYKDHRVDIVKWGRGAGNADLPQIASVRQNLELIVDKGAVVPDIDNHHQSTDARNLGRPTWWGWLVGNSAWVWRSGWGVTSAGAIIYVGGPGLTVRDLANRLVDAGAVRALEGDINPHWITGNLYSVDANGVCHGEKGLSQPLNQGGFRRSGDRYLRPDGSDFIAVFADHSRWVP